MLNKNNCSKKDKDGNKEIIVDAVITWVDGNDPIHKVKMKSYMVDKDIINNKSFRTRFDQVNEIEFTVKSILKYAKFVRNIFIVTDNQIPDFLKENREIYASVKIIDHKEIFKGSEEFLPTFSSRSIETKLYKIPDLAEHYIYFNDDFFLLKETKLEDFFINGLPVLRGKWKKYDEDIFYKKIKYFFLENKKEGHKIGQQKGAKILKLKKYFKFHHVPQSFRKSTLNFFFKENHLLEEANIKHRFRSKNQFISQSLANHIEIKNKTCVLKPDYQMIYMQNYKKPLLWLKFKLNILTKKRGKLFLCMQSLDKCSVEKLTFIKNWFQNTYN